MSFFGNGGSLFGGQAPATSSFFGGGTSSSQPTTSFGGNTPTGSTGFFGTPPQSSSFGLFSNSSNQAAGTSVPFKAQEDSDSFVKNGKTQQIRVKLQCITLMANYSEKSLEELRLEDYQLNRHKKSDTTTSSAPSTGVFSLFGHKTSQQQPSSGSFLQPGSSTSGQQPHKPIFSFSSPSASTSTAPTPFSLGNPTFARTVPATSAFGSAAPSTSSPFGMFGTPKPPQAQPAAAFSFGSATTTAGTSSPATPNTFPSFGSGTPTATQPTTGFTGFGFLGRTGTVPTPSAPQQQAQSSFSFGTPSAFSFPATPVGSSAFAPQPQPFSFGPNPRPSTASGTMHPGNLYATPATPWCPSIAVSPTRDCPFTYTMPPNQPATEQTRPSPTTSPTDNQSSFSRRKYQPSNSEPFSLSACPAIQRLTYSIKNRATSISSFAKSINEDSDKLENDNAELSVNILAPKSDVKQLNLKSLEIIFGERRTKNEETGSEKADATPMRRVRFQFGKDAQVEAGDAPMSHTERFSSFPSARQEEEKSSQLPRAGCGVVHTRNDYYLIPSLEELDEKVDAQGNCIVLNLEIGRKNFGRIRYLQPVNIANQNIDSLVHIRHKELEIYPEESSKPEMGEGLNVPAEITLERVWPKDRAANELIRDPNNPLVIKFEEILRESCDRMGALFVSYNKHTGHWVFRLNHF